MFLRQHERIKDGKEHSYWSLVETVRTADGPRQRTLCYLGDLNGSAHARWQKTAVALRKKSVRDEFVNKNLRETLDCYH
jgi:hypothetical protein